MRDMLHPADELPDAEDPMRVQQWTAIAFICNSNAVAFGSASPVDFRELGRGAAGHASRVRVARM